MKINQQKWPPFLFNHIVFLLFVGQEEDGRKGVEEVRRAGALSVGFIQYKYNVSNYIKEGPQLQTDITIFDTP